MQQHTRQNLGPLTITIPAAVRQAIEIAARKDRRSISFKISEILTEWIALHEEACSD